MYKRQLLRKILTAAPKTEQDYRLFYNVNFPPVPAAGVNGSRVAVQGFRQGVTFGVEPHLSPSGRRFLWIKGHDQRVPSTPGSDADVNLDGYISITPMRADLTAHDMLSQFESLNTLPIPRWTFKNRKCSSSTRCAPKG